MIKKEVAEIKKLFTPERCPIDRIAGCYVDAEKEKKTVFSNTFLALEEETVFKYLEIFKKNLSGSIGKNLYNMEFPLKEEKSGGKQEFLLQLLNNELREREPLDQFFDQVIEHYTYAGNYLILLIHSVYDIPGKGTDNLTMDDASEEVYPHIMCMICPVELSKPGLSYYENSNDFKNRTRDWVTGMPEIGFLFPAFNERSKDIHSLLYHVKSSSAMHEDFVENVLGCQLNGTDKDQENAFAAIIENTLSDKCTFENVKQVFSDLEEMVEDDQTMTTIGKSQMSHILEPHMDTEETFEKAWQEQTEVTGEIYTSSVNPAGKCMIKADNIEIKTENSFSEAIEMKLVDGRKCLIIPIEQGITVNGIYVEE